MKLYVSIEFIMVSSKIYMKNNTTKRDLRVSDMKSSSDMKLIVKCILLNNLLS